MCGRANWIKWERKFCLEIGNEILFGEVKSSAHWMYTQEYLLQHCIQPQITGSKVNDH